MGNILLFLVLCCNLSMQSGSTEPNQNLNQGATLLPPLNYNILNKGESFKIPLDNYFAFARNYSVEDNTETGNLDDKLDLQFNLDKIQLQAQETMYDNATKISLNLTKIYDVKSIYNQPNKLFLLENNIIMMYSYRQKSQSSTHSQSFQQYLKQKNINLTQNYPQITILNISNVAKFPNIKLYNLNCTQMEAFPFQGGYKLILHCKMQIFAPPQFRNYMIGLNMDQDNRGFIINLSYNDSNYIKQAPFLKAEDQSVKNQSKMFRLVFGNKLKELRKQKEDNKRADIKKMLNNYLSWYGFNKRSQESCQDYHLKYFQKLYIAPKDKYNHIVMAYCNSTSNVRPYSIGFFKKRLMIKCLIERPDPNINNCLYNSKYIAQYQNGFLSAIEQSISMRSYLRFFKYEARLNDKAQTQVVCQQYNMISLLGYLFITSRNQSGVQTVYVIFSDRIYIFQSYSPNFQTLDITYQGLVLKSYAISNQMLFLHFEDLKANQYTIMTYNIKSMYPHLIDRAEFPMNNQTQLYFFSVMNYLQSANYFFIYERKTNNLKLVYYEGQYVTISVKNPFNAVGYQNISIVNCSQADFNQCIQRPQTRVLPIHIKIRAFCDSSIEIVPLETIKLNSKLFNIDLVKAVLGPLGRFYKMKNPSTSLQFVNSFHEIDISGILSRFNGKKLITFSIDTFLNDPILTFYFEDFLVLQCDLEFDFYLMRPLITRCVEVITQSEQNPDEIIIYEQGKFLQFILTKIQFCRISSSRDVICIEADNQTQPIKKIKLIQYKPMDEYYDFISVFVIFEKKFKQKDYLIRTNATTEKDIQISVNLVITQNEIEYLKSMTIRTVEYDDGYQHFLVVYMMDYFNPINHPTPSVQTHSPKNSSSDQFYSAQQDSLNQTFFHIVQIYSKPQLQRGQSSNFIGHLIQQFTSNEGQELENIYIIENKIIILSIEPNGSKIEEFKIEDFKCEKSRNYPLYDHRITKNGSHSINSGFLFVEVLEDGVSKFLVYNPSLNTTNIITHSFEKMENQRLMFIQKISPSENVMAIHGNKLITLSLPNMVIRLNQMSNQNPNNLNQPLSVIDKSNLKLEKSHKNHNQLEKFHNPTDQSKQNWGGIKQNLEGMAMLDLSFIDNNDILRVISFKYSYDINGSNFQYLAQIQKQVKFEQIGDNMQIEIDPSQITGPVSEYAIQNLNPINNYQSDPDQNICQFLKVNTSDIFTKKKCIKYIDSKADGIMQDFLTYQPQPYKDITIIVTDQKILCLQNMEIQQSVLKNKTKLCNIFDSQSNIFIVCIENNTTTINKLQMKGDCLFERIWIPKPEILKYNLFKMVISQGKAIFEVPIRSEKNKVYYLTNFIDNKTFEDSLILLKHGSQQEFITKDFTTHGTFMFLLENGLGIYNLSKGNNISKKITPDTWISESTLMTKFNLKEQLKEQLTYVNCLQFNVETQQIILQIGATFQSFELQLNYKYNKSADALSDSIYVLDQDIKVHYTYKNPWSCYNTLLSKSRYYKNMTIKMCSYIPDQHYIFSNFIPISQNKQNSYIVFYQKNFLKNQSYPFRMDIIYTNIYSNDNFQIPMHKAKLLIGSLFNLLCQYDLRDTFKIIFSLDLKLRDFVQDNKNTMKLQQKCNYSLKISNQDTHKSYQLTINLDFENKNRNYWTDWKHWIQRVIFLLIIVNFVRLEFAKRSEKARVSKLKIKGGRSNSFDQTFDLHVRLNSKKSL